MVRDHEHDWRLRGEDAYCAADDCDAEEKVSVLVLTGWQVPEQADAPLTQMPREQGT